MVKVLAQEMKTVGVKNFTVHTCTLLTLLQYMYMLKKISRELAGQLYSNTGPTCIHIGFHSVKYDHGMIMRDIDC